MKILPNGIAVIEGDGWVSQWVEESGRLDHDWWLVDQICSHITAGDWVVDGGANIGDHTCRYLDSVNPGGRVFAFEPNISAFECLNHNCPGAFRMNRALSNSHETVSLSTPGANIGATHIAGEGEVEAIPLDSLNLNRLDLMKLDLEGYELFALQGAAKTIDRCNPILVIEINHGAMERYGYTHRNIYDFLQSRGYTLETMRPGEDEKSAQYDILCLPE